MRQKARMTAIPRPADDSGALDLAADRTPAETLELFSATRAAFDTVHETLQALGAGLFLCAYHHEIRIMPKNNDGGYDRPTCPRCNRLMRYCLAEL